MAKQLQHASSFLLLAAITIVVHGLRCNTNQHLLVCVAANDDADRACEQPSNVTTTVTGISQILRDHPQCVTLYFTSGVHTFKNFMNMYFGTPTSKLLRIVGTIEPRTTLRCNNRTLSIHRDTSVSNVVFENCSMLLFYNNHYQSLENVTVLRRISFQNCRHIMVKNCTFLYDARDHVDILSSGDRYSLPNTHAHIEIIQSRFYRIGLKIVRHITMKARSRCVIRIINSIFHGNAGHMLIEEKHSDGEDDVNVLIRGCVFLGSKVGTYIIQRSTPDNKLAVTITNSTFSDDS
jgi:hypothetical protein